MTTSSRFVFTAALLLATAHATAQVTFYGGEGFRGRTFVTDTEIDNMGRTGFNDRAASIVVERGNWEVCEDAGFSGRCAEIRPGRYASLRDIGMDRSISSVRPLRGNGGDMGGNGGPRQITFYEGEAFRGRAFNTRDTVIDFSRHGFNDRAASVVVDRGRWEVCEHAGFQGRCAVLRRGSYDSLRDIGLTHQISSVRPVERGRRYSQEVPEAMATPNYAFRQRPDERLYEAPVTSVRAVVGPPNQRCWMERQQVSQPQNNANIGGAVIGGIIGGILGHQVGGGRGKDLATAGGAVAGAVVGSQVGGGRNEVVGADVQRCENVASTTPEFWDVTYNHRGTEHRVQMSAPPVGNTIVVNERGEPRQ
jgi:uncharacterized protein YcfJ